MKTEQPPDSRRDLVILIPGFPADENDSTCLPAQQSFVLALNKQFPEQKLFILSFQYPYTKKEYSWFGNKVFAFGGKNKGGISRWLLWNVIKRIFRDINKESPVGGILSFWCGECSLVGQQLAKKYKLPHYCWIMGQDARKNNSYVCRIKPSADQLIAISDFIKYEFARNHNILPEHVIPLVPDSGSPGSFTSKRDIDIMGAGSLIPLKQFDLFIDVVSDVKKIYPEIRAIICGNGAEKENLETLIAKNGLNKNIVLSDELGHPELMYIMRGTRIFLHTSSYEGFSGVCAEALQCGAHVVSFCKPMKHDIPNWHVVSPIESMRDKILELLGSELDHTPVNLYPVEGAAASEMKLFDPQT